jgi:hypothetical protein
LVDIVCLAGSRQPRQEILGQMRGNDVLPALTPRLDREPGAQVIKGGVAAGELHRNGLLPPDRTRLTSSES